MSFKQNAYNPGGPEHEVSITPNTWTTLWERTLVEDESLAFDLVVKVTGGTPKRMGVLRILFAAYRDGAAAPRITNNVMHRSEDLPGVLNVRQQSIGTDTLRFQIRFGGNTTYSVSTRSLEL